MGEVPLGRSATWRNTILLWPSDEAESLEDVARDWHAPSSSLVSLGFGVEG